MKTQNGTKCGGRHNKHFLADYTAILTIHDRRYTICSHAVGRTYCGELIDVTDGLVVFCCGDERNHNDRPMLGVD